MVLVDIVVVLLRAKIEGASVEEVILVEAQ